MNLWIDNGAFLKSSSPWQLKEFLKFNNSVHEALSQTCPGFHASAVKVF